MKLTERYLEYVRNIFRLSQGKLPQNNPFLTKQQLRQLEKKEYVEKVPVYGKRKFVDVTPPMSYVYIWKIPEELNRANSTNKAKANSSGQV